LTGFSAVVSKREGGVRKNQRLLSSILILSLFVMACSCGLLGKNNQIPEPQNQPLAPITEATLVPQEPTLEPASTEIPSKIKGELVAVPVNGEALMDIMDLWTAPDGNLWVATLDGIYIQSGEGWTHTLEGTPVDRIAGAGKSGEVWVIPDGARSIFAYSAGEWKEYGPGQGWEPLPESQYLSPSNQDDVTISPEGQVWLATGLDDLRRYDPGTDRWKKYTAAQIGFPRYNEPDYQGYFLTDAALSSAGKVWVGACIGEGESLMGRGVVRLSEGNWSSIPTPETACVLDIEVDPNGEAFVGDYDHLFRYSPVSGNWTKEILPGYDRSQLVERIDLDASGQPWVKVRRMGGASSFGGTAVYYLQKSGGWVLAYEPTEWINYDFAAAPNGDVYFSSNASVMRWKDRQLQEAGVLDGTAVLLAVDGNGNPWAAVLEGPDYGLWKVVP
jgi:hypothetical protein